MKIQVATYEEIEVDDNFPYYRKNNAFIYKVADETDFVCVSLDGVRLQIEVPIYNLGFVWKETKEATREEFEAAFTKVHEALLELAK
jgi:hypothetical protein